MQLAVKVQIIKIRTNKGYKQEGLENTHRYETSCKNGIVKTARHRFGNWCSRSGHNWFENLKSRSEKHFYDVNMYVGNTRSNRQVQVNAERPEGINS
jgi:hypothetical protein